MDKKKNLAILLNEGVKKNYKYYKIFSDLKKKYKITYFIIPFEKKKIVRENDLNIIRDVINIKKKIEKLKFAYFIDLLFYPDNKNQNNYYITILKKNQQLREIFKKNGAKSLRFSFANLSKWNYFPFNILSAPKYIFRKIRNIFLPKWKRDISCNYLIAQGNYLTHNLNFGTAKLIYSHNLDFDEYIRAIDKTKKSRNYAVYIDQLIGEHPDYKQGSTVVKVENKFQEELAIFFNEIEKRLNLKVKISPHPKRKKLNKKIYERKINFKVSSYKLIKNSKLVLGHDSAAISLAIIFKKPIIFIISNSIKNRKIIDRINQYAKYFKKETLNISLDFEHLLGKSIFDINENSYNKYHDQFIQHPRSDGKTISNQIIKALE